MPDPLKPGWPADMPTFVRAMLEAQGVTPDDIITVDLDALREGRMEAVSLHAEPENFTPNPPPPPSMLKGIPFDSREDRHGFPTAYLRLYTQKPEDRGEWFVLCLPNRDPHSAYCWVKSPWGPGADDLGSVDLTALDRYTQVFDCGPIILDMAFTPRPFDWQTGETHNGRFEVLREHDRTVIASFDKLEWADEYVDRLRIDGDNHDYTITEAEDAP